MFQYVILPCDKALDSQTGIRGNGKAIPDCDFYEIGFFVLRDWSKSIVRWVGPFGIVCIGTRTTGSTFPPGKREGCLGGGMPSMP